MSTFELSSYELAIPDDAYTTLSQNMACSKEQNQLYVTVSMSMGYMWDYNSSLLLYHWGYPILQIDELCAQLL